MYVREVSVAGVAILYLLSNGYAYAGTADAGRGVASRPQTLQRTFLAGSAYAQADKRC